MDPDIVLSTQIGLSQFVDTVYTSKGPTNTARRTYTPHHFLNNYSETSSFEIKINDNTIIDNLSTMILRRKKPDPKNIRLIVQTPNLWIDKNTLR